MNLDDENSFFNFINIVVDRLKIQYIPFSKLITDTNLPNHKWFTILDQPFHAPSWKTTNKLPLLLNKINDEKDIFKQNCQTIISYSQSDANELNKYLSGKINVINHPLPYSTQKWSYDHYKIANKKNIIQIETGCGCLNAIYLLPKSSFNKFLFTNISQTIIKEKLIYEREHLSAINYHSNTEVNIIFSEINAIEQFYSSSIFISHLYDFVSEWNILKCFSDNAPLLINRLPSVVDYLGNNYPFYYSCYEEAIDKAKDITLIKETNEYMKKRFEDNSYTLQNFLIELSNTLC